MKYLVNGFERDFEITKRIIDNLQMMKRNCDVLEKELDILEPYIKNESGKAAIEVFRNMTIRIRPDLSRLEETVMALHQLNMP